MSDYLEDGTFDWSLGQDSWHSPDRIQPNQYWKGVNVVSRGGVIAPRDSYVHRPLVFDTQQIKTKFGYYRTTQSVWESGKFQAAIPLRLGSNSYVLTVISGLIFRTNVDTLKTHLLSDTVKLDQYVSRINWCYAGEKVVLYDYPDYPVIVDGETVTRSDPQHKVAGVLSPQVPISVLGTFNQNRLFVGNAGVEFTAGDGVGNTATPEAPLTFSEVFTPSSPYYQQVFSLPVVKDPQPISAMGFIQELDSSTGIGSLVVSTRSQLYFYNTNQPRSAWEQSRFGGLLLDNAGIAGARAFTNINSDLVFMSEAGRLHALSTARNEAKRWSNVPISREVQNFVKFTDTSLSRLAVLNVFNNRVFATVNPYRVQALDVSQQPVTDYAHAGFIVLDIDSLSSFLSEGTPVWLGAWTGINPLEVCVLGERCFIVSKDGSQNLGVNRLYELLTTSGPDQVNNRKRPVRSIVYTRLYNFKDTFGQKREHTLAFHLQDLAGDVSLNVERKPSHSASWLQSNSWKHTASVTTCAMPADALLNGMEQHQLKQIVFGDAVEQGCNPLDNDDYQTFRAIQYRFTITGENWTLNDFKVRAEIIPFLERQEASYCEELPKKLLPAQCDPDWLIPEETLCPM